MKKIFAIVITFAMLLSLAAVVASAEVPNVPWTPGAYNVDPSDFSPVGEVKITWDPDASKKLDLSDGDMADWAAAGYDMITIDASNMVNWGGLTAMPEGWNISTYFVADADWFYIGFFVTDPNFAYGTGGAYNGDAFQVCIDFGGKLGKVVETDPDLLTNPKNMFYSFSCAEEGAPLEIMRQESDQDGWLSEANGDGVKGAAKKTETGWSAEFALSWQQMYDDYVWKAWEDDPKIYVGSDEVLPLNMGCALYYLDRSETNGSINWAAGTTNGIILDDGNPGVSWTCYDNGVQAKLEYVEGMEFNCTGLVVLPTSETTPEETTAAEEEEETTEAPEETTEAPVEETTEAPAADTTAADTTAADTTTADKGCGSVIGFSAIAVLAAAAAAVALKKD